MYVRVCVYVRVLYINIYARYTVVIAYTRVADSRVMIIHAWSIELSPELLFAPAARFSSCIGLATRPILVSLFSPVCASVSESNRVSMLALVGTGW